MPRTGERGGPQTRARIAAAAAVLFLERGFDAVTVAEVAREAGVSSVTVFNHFPRKEDLFLDRSAEAEALLVAAVRDRPDGTDVLTALQDSAVRLAEERHPLSGLDERSVPFFRTIGGSPALIARVRELAAGLQRILAEELEHESPGGADAGVLAALVVAGSSAVLVETARRRLAGAAVDEVADDHLTRTERLYVLLRNGVAATA